MQQHEIQNELLLAGEPGVDLEAGMLGSLGSGNGQEGIGHMGQHSEKIDVLSIDDPLHPSQLIHTKALFCQTLEQLGMAAKRSRQAVSAAKVRDQNSSGAAKSGASASWPHSMSIE
ncbi:MAG: hypothetical protein WBN80_13375 [Prochlorococcaceae cyanobacterium]